MNISIIIILYLVGAILTYASGNKLASKVALGFSILTTLVSLYLLSEYTNGANLNVDYLWIDALNVHFNLVVDGLSMAMVLLTTILTPLIIASGLITKFENSRGIYALALLMCSAMIGTFLAADGLLYYIFWEIALIPIYFIALKWGNGKEESRKKAIIKFFIYTFAGSLFMLLAFGYLYTKTGSFNIQDFYALNLKVSQKRYLFWAFFLAYAIKIPIIPFHTWQANTYAKSPAIGTMLLSGIMLKMGLYSVIRWQLPITDKAAEIYKPIVVVMAIVGVIYGAILTLKQDNAKKLLAYSSLSHVGLIAAGLYTLNYEGLQGAVLQMLSHGLIIVGSFLFVELLYNQFGTFNIQKMGGVRLQAPKFATLSMIVVLASVALPTTFNFIGEFNLLYSLFIENIWYAIIAGITVILGAFYMLRMYQIAFLGKVEKEFKEVPMSNLVVLIIIVGLTFFFGLYPQPIIDLIKPSLVEILNQIKY